MVSERENYFDRWERGEYSIDPRDLVRREPVKFGSVGVIDREAFDRFFKVVVEPPITGEQEEDCI